MFPEKKKHPVGVIVGSLAQIPVRLQGEACGRFCSSRKCAIKIKQILIKISLWPLQGGLNGLWVQVDDDIECDIELSLFLRPVAADCGGSSGSDPSFE